MDTVLSKMRVYEYCTIQDESLQVTVLSRRRVYGYCTIQNESLWVLYYLGGEFMGTVLFRMRVYGTVLSRMRVYR